jgi:hypothetical protein
MGPGACISTTGGLLKFGAGVTRRVDNGGVIAALGSTNGTIELGANAALIAEADGNLVCNTSATWIFGSNSKVEVHGRVVVGNAVTMNLPSTSQMYAYPGARFELGSGASITTEGKFHAVGTEEDSVEFVKKPGSVNNWQGIIAKSNDAELTGDIKFEYVSMSDPVKAIHIETPVQIAEVLSTSINGASIGIEIVPNTSITGEFTEVPATMIIRNSTTTNTISSIVVDNYSDLLIDGCTLTRYGGEISSNGIWLTNSSPTILSTSITGFGSGIYGITHSKPVLQNRELGAIHNKGSCDIRSEHQ